MKRIISITITLCLVFCSVLPVYAEAWTSTQANNVTSDVNDIQHDISIIEMIINMVFRPDSQYDSTPSEGSLQMMAINLAEIRNMLETWLIPRNITSSTGYLGLWDYVWYLANQVGTLWGGWDGYFSHLVVLPSINTNINDLELGLTNYFRDAESVNVVNRKLNTHTALVNSKLEYTIKNINSSNVISEEILDWQNGSPLGNIAVILQRMANNDTTGLGLFLDHTVGTTFGIWDSRDSTVPVEEPNAWTPYSAVHGLYTYLAYLQRDVALMSWVVANPSDLIIRQDTEGLNNAYYDNFVDPDSDNTFTAADMDEVGDLASGYKDNFDTGQSASGIWNVFDRNYDWFSQTTANNLQPSLTRGPEEYSTPYLDEYYIELNSILEVNKRD